MNIFQALIWSPLFQLVQASDESGVTTVLFDPVIIDAFHNNAHLVNNPEACVFLCHVVGPLIFAANYNDIKDNVSCDS